MNEQTTQDHHHRCKINRINAEMMEDAVLSRLNEIIISENYLPNVQDKIMDRVNERLERDQDTISSLSKKLAKIDCDIEATFQLSTGMKGEKKILILIKERLTTLMKNKEETTNTLSAFKEKVALTKLAAKQNIPTVDDELIKLFWKGWKKTSPVQKKNLIRLLIRDIVVTENGLKINYFSQ